MIDLVPERITAEEAGPSRDGHECRYRLAAGYVEAGEAILDAACGVGYGASLVPHAGDWLGVDIAPVVDERYRPFGRWVTADLCTWEPGEAYDVALCFETLEHVADPQAVIATLCQARRLVLCSVPIVPTAGANPHHVRDYTMWDLPREFEARGWSLVQCLLQPSELSAVYVFGRPA